MEYKLLGTGTPVCSVPHCLPTVTGRAIPGHPAGDPRDPAALSYPWTPFMGGEWGEAVDPGTQQLQRKERLVGSGLILPSPVVDVMEGRHVRWTDARTLSPGLLLLFQYWCIFIKEENKAFVNIFLSCILQR